MELYNNLSWLEDKLIGSLSSNEAWDFMLAWWHCFSALSFSKLHSYPDGVLYVWLRFLSLTIPCLHRLAFIILFIDLHIADHSRTHHQCFPLQSLNRFGGLNGFSISWPCIVTDLILIHSAGVASDMDGIDGSDKSESKASCYEKFGAVMDEKLEAFFTKWGTGNIHLWFWKLSGPYESLPYYILLFSSLQFVRPDHGWPWLLE